MQLFDVYTIRLFLRLLLGFILVSGAISKLSNPSKFGRAIQDYKVLPQKLESKASLSRLLSFGIPLSELVVGLGLITGFLLVPVVILAIGLFVIFNGAIIFNLTRGRTDLSCHCGGMLDDHRISWWLVGRNILLIVCFLFLLLTPFDNFTLTALLYNSSSISVDAWMTIVVPVVLLVSVVLAVIVVFNAARILFHS